MNDVLTVDRLNFNPGDAPLFENWSACFGAGVTVVRGDTGSGKSTLLRLLAGWDAVDGDIRVNAISLADDPAGYRREVFWCDPMELALDGLTPPECFDLWRRQHPRFEDDALPAHIDGFALAPHLAKSMYQLSTGTRRKVVLAGALACGAAATLLDDPASALDGPSVRHLMQALRDGAEQPTRAWIVASYEALDKVPGARLIDLPG